MKIMICQPKENEKTIEELKEEKEKVIKHLKEMGYEVVDEELLLNKRKENTSLNIPIYNLAKEIEIMSKVDSVFFMNDWIKSKSCTLKYDIAKAYNLILLFES